MLCALKSTVSVCHEIHTGKAAKKLQTFDIKKKDVSYVSCDSRRLLGMEGLASALHLLKETYVNDPLGPRSLSAWRPPPVGRFIAIYGINLPTEVSCALSLSCGAI